ncbi:MAG: hypothetical protein WBL61_09705 [Bryobacteraceae bacterium]
MAAYEASSQAPAPVFSPGELYVMLSAILFHDIGRLISGGGHGQKSKELIDHDHASLGIDSEELAHCIARVCAFHDNRPKEAKDELWKLGTAVVDPYGRIRERALAALLMLIDHLDGAYTRVPPQYIRSQGEAESVGAFRRAVRGVEVDLEGQMVTVGISDQLARLQTQAKISNLQLNADRLGKNAGQLPKKFAAEFQHAPSRDIRLWQAVLPQASDPSPADRAIIWQLAFPRKKRNSSEEGPIAIAELSSTKVWSGTSDAGRQPREQQREQWAAATLLALLMGNTRENVEALAPIRGTLAAIGIPVRGWLLEYRDHLFNEQGAETCEPVFSREYLIGVARGMWSLSTRIFGHETLNYETLASEIGEPDAGRVRRAVRRIDILTRPDEPNVSMKLWPIDRPALWAGHTGWKWRVERDDTRCDEAGQPSCTFVRFEDVTDRLKELAEPVQGALS